MKHSKLWLLVMLLCLSLVMFAACGAQPAEDDSAGDVSAGVEQKLHITQAAIPTIDPQLFNAAPSYVAIKGFAEGLVRTFKEEINPGVAESWEISDDNMQMTFHLREDACWADGSPLTAQDFVYAFQRLADPATAASYSWVLYEIVNAEEIMYGTPVVDAAGNPVWEVDAAGNPVQEADADGNPVVDDAGNPVYVQQIDYLDPSELGVSAPDDHTFVINFHTPAPYYLGFLDMPCFYPVKQELVEQYGDQYALSADKMLGNGPFVVTSYNVDQEIVMVKNENYWNKDAIKLEEVTITVMADEAAFALLETGELDYSQIPVTIAPGYLDNPDALSNATAYTYMSGAVDWFSINIGSETNPILGNQDFRLALNYALDREDYIAITSSGIYEPATRFVLPAVAGVNDTYFNEYPIEVFSTTAELDKAQEHLQKAMDAMGISDPSEISIELMISDTDTSKLIVENVQDQLKNNLGIDVTINQVTYRAMIDNRIAGDFDLVYAGWMPDYDDPYTYLSYFVSTNSQNGGKYDNERYDELVNTANEYPDAATRLAMYAEAEELLLTEAAIIPLQVRQVPAAMVNNLENAIHYFTGMQIDYTYAYFTE